MAIPVAGQPGTGDGLHVAGRSDVLDGGQDRPGQGVFTAGLHGRGQVEDLLGGDAIDGRHLDDAWPVGGQGAGLVQRDTAYRAQSLQGRAALDQGAELAGGADRGDHGDRH